MMINNKRILTGLEHHQYEHPFDKAALEKLEKIPFLKTTAARRRLKTLSTTLTCCTLRLPVRAKTCS